MAKQKIIYSEKYTAPGMRVLKEFHPALPHVTTPHELVDVYLTEAGRVEIEGRKLEYQVLRIYIALK